MKNMDELEEYIEKTEDSQLGMILSIVREYGDEIPEIINDIKKIHVSDSERDKAEFIFSTVHRSKGMEYDTVRLVNDFITEAKLEKFANDPAFCEAGTEKLNEEINLLYVAVTRAKNVLYIPADLVPTAANHSDSIHIADDAEWYNSIAPPKKPVRNKAYSANKVRKKHANAYKPWTPELDDELTVMYCGGKGTKEIAKHFERKQGAIMTRVN
jgi:ATP-dependent exoDNAse (exonuclease V) beta subunit